MNKIPLLLVEDELSLAFIIEENLNNEGYSVNHCADGNKAIEFYRTIRPQVVVLDIMLPGKDGFTIAKEIRNFDRLAPILFLSSRTQVEDVVTAFNLGANDYIRKPFKIQELLVRVNALAKRNSENDIHYYHIGQYQLDIIRQTLKFKKNEIKLSFRECILLQMLYEHKNSVLSREELIYKVWPNDKFLNGRSLDVFISKFRVYFKEDPHISIVNVRAKGYKLSIEN